MDIVHVKAISYLDLSRIHYWLTFQSNNFAGRVHDSGVCRDGPPDGIGSVVHINDNDLCGVSNLLSHTDEFVRLHGECGEADVCCIDAHILELKQ